jgi:hypothetical protein
MRKEDVPYYDDPTGFENGGNKYPCDTQYMVYNPMLHRYYLTPDGLNKYGIEAERLYVSSNPNKIQELIEKTSKKVYDYIQYKSGVKCYPLMMYRIATAPATIYPDQYYMRKQFEEALADQARWLCENGDSARYSFINIASGQKTNPEEDFIRDNSDMSKETMRTLNTLNLTKWFTIGSNVILDNSKY